MDKRITDDTKELIRNFANEVEKIVNEVNSKYNIKFFTYFQNEDGLDFNYFARKIFILLQDYFIRGEVANDEFLDVILFSINPLIGDDINIKDRDVYKRIILREFIDKFKNHLVKNLNNEFKNKYMDFVQKSFLLKRYEDIKECDGYDICDCCKNKILHRWIVSYVGYNRESGKSEKFGYEKLEKLINDLTAIIKVLEELYGDSDFRISKKDNLSLFGLLNEKVPDIWSDIDEISDIDLRKIKSVKRSLNIRLYDVDDIFVYYAF
jgi:hypothetical protein